MVDDALALGIKHAAINCDLGRLLEAEPGGDSPKWTVDGREFAFSSRALERLDAQIKPLSDAGVVVYLIVLVYETNDPSRNAVLLHPKYLPGATPNRISAFNTATADGRAYFQAALEFLAARYSPAESAHGRVWGWIIGNEVNSHWWWYNMGRAQPAEVVRAYEDAVRLAHSGVRKASAHARVYLSLEHHWNIRYPAGAPDQAMPGRELLQAFAALTRERGDFDWHIAFHPYPENLGDPRFWNDQTATRAPDTPRITFKNLELLTQSVRRPELLHNGETRRVILSEQGFHCRAETPEAEREQAAAWCAAWWKVTRLGGIDAFILHRHVDHANEGLNLGLWTRAKGSVSTPDRQRAMYEVFRLADTPAWASAFEFALPIIGIERWDELMP